MLPQKKNYGGQDYLPFPLRVPNIIAKKNRIRDTDIHTSVKAVKSEGSTSSHGTTPLSKHISPYKERLIKDKQQNF